jgi:hypothetical protein
MVYAPHRVRANRSKHGDRGGDTAAIHSRLNTRAGAPIDPAQMVAHGNQALVALAIEIGEQVLVDPQRESSRQQRQSDFWDDMYRYRRTLVVAGSTAIGLLAAVAVLLSGLVETVLPPRSAAIVAAPSMEQLYGHVSAPSPGTVSASVRAVAAGQEPAGIVSISPAVTVSAPVPSLLEQAIVLGNVAPDQHPFAEAAAPLPSASSEATTNSPGVSMSDVTASIPRPQPRLEERTDFSASNSASIGRSKKLTQKMRRLQRTRRLSPAPPEPSPIEEVRPPAEGTDAADAIERPDISGRTGSRH